MTLKRYVQKLNRIAKKYPDAIVLRDNGLCNYAVYHGFPSIGWGRFESHRVFFSKNKPMDMGRARRSIVF